jgi:hypothetical protein
MFASTASDRTKKSDAASRNFSPAIRAVRSEKEAHDKMIRLILPRTGAE